MTYTHDPRPSDTDAQRLPLGGLLALGAAGFITIMTEALPAGILPAMAADLEVSEAAAGQTVTIYAIGSAMAAVPLTAATLGWPRKRLLLIAIGGFAIANTVTAISASYALTMGARFLAGVAAGLTWALLAGYARRMVPAHQRGKAMAIAMAGTPVALSIGVPAGTFLASLVGWRYTFGTMTLLTVVLIAWTIAKVPVFAGTAAHQRLPIARTLSLPGVLPVLTVTLSFVLAHNILYTYIAPFLAPLGLASRVDLVLLVFGLASLASILITGVLIDRHLRPLMIAACALFAGATLALATLAAHPPLVFASAAIWGLAFGGASTLLQTASAEAAGAAGDVAQSLIVTCWNLAIASGGLIGGLLLANTGPAGLPWAVLGLLAIALVTAVAARKHGFPNATRRKQRHRNEQDTAYVAAQ